ncbi:MAG TPA: hypothetical protein VM580_06825 [Labilithrix sp.]|nr:hypothetical protein [Labilithrix sp.]
MRRRSRLVLVLLGAIATAVGTVAGVACSSAPPVSGAGTSPPANNSMNTTVDVDGGANDASLEADTGTPEVCLGEVVPADAGTVSCPDAGECAAACNRIVANYRAGVAHAAVECIVALSVCESADNVIPCVDTAMSLSCPDPTSEPYCSDFVLECDPDAGGMGAAISPKGCERFANALSDAGKTEFRACVEEKILAGTCKKDVAMCADAIRQ